MLVKDVMTKSVEVVNPDATLAEAAKRMRDGDFGALPVGENDRLVGMITDRDICCRGVAEGKDPKSAVVREVMSEHVAWCFEDQPVEECAQIMGEKKIRRLPILNRNKRLVGIVALGDIAVEAEEPAAQALSDVSNPTHH